MRSEQKRKQEIITLAVVFAGVLVVTALAVYYLGTSRQEAPAGSRQIAQPAPSIEVPQGQATPEPRIETGREDSIIDRMFGIHTSGAHVLGATWAETMGRIMLRFMLAALLGAALAFRPRKKVLALKRNPYVAQTQILLAIVAAALMIVVGDNAARAFGIFAAVSLVRFRTNIRDPKEITVLLISLALGLSSGVGRWDLALVLAFFALVVLWLLEWREPELVFRSMDLKVTTKNVVSTQKALRQVFKQHGFDKELRAVDREASEESPGSIRYSVDVSPNVSTDELSADILALDGQNVEGIEWDQKKSYSYLYQ